LQYLPRINGRKLVLNEGNQFDTVKVMRGMILESAFGDNFVNNLINALQLEPNLNGIKKAAKHFYLNTFFDPDTPEIQTVRSPRRLLKDRAGNCVDYSTAVCSVATALNLPCSLVIAATNPIEPKNYNHVFAMVGKTPIDLVIKQDQTGKEKFIPARKRNANFNSAFGAIAPHFDYRIYPINYTKNANSNTKRNYRGRL